MLVKRGFSSFLMNQTAFLNWIPRNRMIGSMFPRASFVRCFRCSKTLRSAPVQVKTSAATVLARSNRKELRRLIGLAKTEKLKLTGMK